MYMYIAHCIKYVFYQDCGISLSECFSATSEPEQSLGIANTSMTILLDSSLNLDVDMLYNQSLVSEEIRNIYYDTGT